MRKIFLAVLTFIFGLFLSWKVLPAKAYALTETDGDLQVTYDSSLFGPEIIWYPGISATKNFIVKNNGSSTHTAYIKAINTIENGNLSTVMYFRVSETGVDRYGTGNSKTMRNFWDEGEVALSDVGGGNTTTYDVTVAFWEGAGNGFQEKQAKFDFGVGFKGTGNEVVVSGGTTGGGGGDTGSGTTTTTSPAPVLGAVSPPFHAALPAVAGISEEASPQPSTEVAGETAPEGQVEGAAVRPLWPHLWWLLVFIPIFLFYFASVKPRA